MSWSFSRGLVEEFLAQCLSDTGLSALLSTTHSPDQYYSHGKPTEHSRISRFGMTCEPLTDTRGEELLTWFLAGSRARTSASQEAGPDWTARGQGYGEKWLGLLARFDPATSSLKTAQLSLLEDSTECSPTLPRWGLMLDGELYPQPMPALITSEPESGFWPTQNCIGYRSGGELKLLSNAAASHAEYMAMSDRACKSSGDGLATFAKKYPTPCASDDRDRGNTSTPAVARRIEKGKQVMLSMCVSSESGRLNPEWVEWLMGWPIGHTGLSALETDRFREFAQQHGKFCMESKDAA